MSDRPHLAIIRCPRHGAFWAVDVDGNRVTPSKCCGQWRVVQEWFLTRAEWVELGVLANAAAARMRASHPGTPPPTIQAPPSSPEPNEPK